jgi:hypothetical protein
MDEKPGMLQQIMDFMLGGKGTKELRTPTGKPPIPVAQDNTMVKAAAEEAAKRARSRGELAPEAAAALTGPKKPMK